MMTLDDALGPSLSGPRTGLRPAEEAAACLRRPSTLQEKPAPARPTREPGAGPARPRDVGPRPPLGGPPPPLFAEKPVLGQRFPNCVSWNPRGSTAIKAAPLSPDLRPSVGPLTSSSRRTCGPGAVNDPVAEVGAWGPREVERPCRCHRGGRRGRLPGPGSCPGGRDPAPQVHLHAASWSRSCGPGPCRPWLQPRPTVTDRGQPGAPARLITGQPRADALIEYA